MAISNQDRDNLTRWGHRVAHEDRGWTEEERADALIQFSIAYHTAADDRERFSVLWCFHEGYRQRHNVSEQDCAELVLTLEELATVL